MKQVPNKPCRLCGQLKRLQNSHLFPKFYWDWMKKSGGGYFRDPKKPNVKMQDGHKKYLLCADCEGLFSGWETATARHVFKPIVANPTKPVHYDSWFYRFLLSLLWRNLAVDLDERGHTIPTDFQVVEKAWRLFLLDQQPLGVYNRLHVFVSDIPLPGSPMHSVYLTRDTDFSVVTNGSTPCAVYAKFAKFLIWAEVTPVKAFEWVNTLVIDGVGILPSGVQKIFDRGFGDFVISRGEMMKAKKKELHDGMSQPQREKVQKWVLENADRLANSELLTAMRADSACAWIEPPSIPKAGRNDACPCGSGKKYKKCHGS
jgi:hypothetical protein